MRLFPILAFSLLPVSALAQIDANYEGTNGILAQVFEPNCVTCHASTVSGGDRRGAPTSVNFDTYDTAVQFGSRAVARSALGTSMPPSFSGVPALTQAQADALIAWQDAGFPRSATVTPTNEAPTANAGTAQSVNEGDSVLLSGSGNDPEDGSNVSFAWTQTSGATVVTLTGATTSQASFTAPEVSAAGDTLIFQLTVTDSGGLTDSQTVTVSVVDVPVVTPNTPPTANAGSPQAVTAGQLVTLNGLASSDPEDTTVSSYSWTQTAGTAVSLSNSTSAQPTFIAPNVTAEQTLTFVLSVQDSEGLANINTDTDTVSITVSPATAQNTPPVAIAAAVPNAVASGETVTLVGDASNDSEDTVLTSFFWQQTSGSNVVTLSNPTGSQATFTAPDGGASGDVLGFTLTVTDSGGLSSISVVSVQILPSTPATPVASFDFFTGILNIPGVQVGTDILSVQLTFVPSVQDAIAFDLDLLTGLSVLAPGSTVLAAVDLQTSILTIPTVDIGNGQTLSNISLSLGESDSETTLRFVLNP